MSEETYWQSAGREVHVDRKGSDVEEFER